MFALHARYICTPLSRTSCIFRKEVVLIFLTKKKGFRTGTGAGPTSPCLSAEGTWRLRNVAFSRCNGGAFSSVAFQQTRLFLPTTRSGGFDPPVCLA